MFLRRKLAAIFAAAAVAGPAGLALSQSAVTHDYNHNHGHSHNNDMHSRYGGELVVQPPHSARIDTTLTIQSSETSLSRRLAALQERFGNLMPNVKLVVIDKDWFQQNAVLNGGRAYQMAPTDEEKATIRRLTSEYVRERMQISFNPDAFTGLERNMLSTEGMAIKFQYGSTSEDAKNSDQSICLLYPHFADRSRDQYYSDFIGRYPSINGDVAEAPLREPMEYEYMKRFVDYHEIGHCYDRWYIKKIPTSNGPRDFIENRHKTEIFGEVFANLMLARDGYQDFSEKQADLRLAIAAFDGPISTRVNDPVSIGYYMPFVYLLHEGSRNAGREIERLGVENLQALSMDEILELAHEITERSAFDIDYGMAAMGYMMSNAYDLSKWEQKASPTPDEQQIYHLMLRLRYDMEQAVRRTFNYGSRVEPVLRPASFDFSNPAFQRVSASALVARSEELGRELTESLGGTPPTAELLAQAYQQKKEALRGILETGDAQAQDNASRDLDLMQMALKFAYDALPQPEAAPEPESQPAPAPQPQANPAAYSSRNMMRLTPAA